MATWLVLMAFARRWAVPGALVAAVVVMGATGTFGDLAPADGVPVIELVAPTWNAGALIAVAVPLFIVTMTSQNIPGIAVLAGFGYRPEMRAPPRSEERRVGKRGLSSGCSRWGP